jgi:sigma-E factor negative regulatory protein RseB
VLRNKLLIPALILTLCLPARAADEASEWLMRMNDAASALNYEGTFVYVHGHTVETMLVVHKTGSGGLHERIYSLNGAGREIIRDAEQVWCYVPDKKIGVHEYRQVSRPGFPNILPQQLNRLASNYVITLGRRDRIADRDSQQIMVKPKDEYRYGYDLWADADTGLMLKAALLDAEGEPIEQYMFVQVVIGGEIQDSALAPSTPKQDLLWYGSAGSEQTLVTTAGVETEDWVVAKLPHGFTLSRSMKRHSPMRNKMIQHFVYSDGLAAVSLFVEELADEEKHRITGMNRMGAIHAFGNVVDGHQITVVGEVPWKTVDMIGMSVTANRP